MKKLIEWIKFELLFVGEAILFSFEMAFLFVNRNHTSLWTTDYSDLMRYTLILSILTVPLMVVIATIFKLVLDRE